MPRWKVRVNVTPQELEALGTLELNDPASENFVFVEAPRPRRRAAHPGGYARMRLLPGLVSRGPCRETHIMGTEIVPREMGAADPAVGRLDCTVLEYFNIPSTSA